MNKQISSALQVLLVFFLAIVVVVVYNTCTLRSRQLPLEIASHAAAAASGGADVNTSMQSMLQTLSLAVKIPTISFEVIHSEHVVPCFTL